MLKSAWLGATCLALSAMAFSSSLALAGDSGLKVIDQIKISGDGSWDYVSFDGVSRKVFVAHGSAIASFDTVTKAVTPHLADATGAHIALPLGDGKTVLVTQGKLNKASIIDAATGALIADIATGPKPDAAVLDPATGRVFVMDNGGTQVDVIDPVARKLVGSVKVSGAPEGGTADGEGLIFTHLEDKNTIVVIDAKTLSVKTTFVMNDCDEPSGIAFVSKGRLLLSACKGGFARVSSADTGAEVARLVTGQRADGALYDPKSGLGYIPAGEGKLTVISFDGQPHVIDQVTTKPGARTATLDPDTGYIYLPTADLGPSATAGGRPAIVPGSFEVVVVGK